MSKKKKGKPRISANLGESRSVTLALAYSKEYARGIARLCKPCSRLEHALAIRQRSAERLTRASGARKEK